MAIAKQIIDIHRGEIYIESKLDVGTDITIILNK